MTVSVFYNTRPTENLGEFFQSLSNKRLFLQKMAKSGSKNPGRALDITADTVRGAACKNPEAALSTITDVINFYHTSEGYHLGKNVSFFV